MKLTDSLSALGSAINKLSARCVRVELYEVIDDQPPPLRSLYPINALRNAALAMAHSELVLCLDVDFLPCAGLFARLEGSGGALRRQCTEERTLLVVPAFESCAATCDAARLAREGKDTLRAAVEAGEARVFASDGRCAGDFPQGHRATDSERWLRSDGAYTVEHEDGYEPFVIAPRRLSPKYDERFCGFGRNKIVQLWEAARVLGFRFEVLPESFVVHVRHEASAAQRAVLGPGPSEAAAMPPLTQGTPALAASAPQTAERLLPEIKALYDRVRLELLRIRCAGDIAERVYGHAPSRHGNWLRGSLERTMGASEPMGRWASNRRPAPDASEAELLAMYELWFDYVPAQLERIFKRGAVGPWRRSALPRGGNEVTLVTCLTVDRLARLAAQCRQWTGILSAAVLLPATGVNHWKRELASLHHSTEREGRCRLDLTLLHERRQRHERAHPPLVPINALRNAALAAAETPLVLLLDVDLLPSAGLHEALTTHDLGGRFLEGCCRRGEIWVLPALESVDRTEMVRRIARISGSWRGDALSDAQLDADDLTKASSDVPVTTGGVVHGGNDMIQERRPGHDADEADQISATVAFANLSASAVAREVLSGVLRGFHTGHYAKGHGPTDFKRWAAARITESTDTAATPTEKAPEHEITYEEGFEPFVLASRLGIPRFDERFRGYGFDKVFFFYQLASELHVSFHVLPCGFAVDVPHTLSADWRATFEPMGDRTGEHRQKVRIQALYARAKREVLLRRQYESILDAPDDESAARVLRQLDTRCSLSTEATFASAAGVPASAAFALEGLRLAWTGTLRAEAEVSDAGAVARLAALMNSAQQEPLEQVDDNTPNHGKRSGRAWWPFSNGQHEKSEPPIVVATAVVIDKLATPRMWAPGRGWRLLTRQGLSNCVVQSTWRPSVASNSLAEAADARDGKSETDIVLAPALTMVAPSCYLRVVLPKGSWSPTATAEMGLDVGGVAIRAEPEACAPFPGGAEYGGAEALRYSVRFASGFAWGRGGTLPGIYTRRNLRVSCGWRGGGIGHVSTNLPEAQVTRIGVWHFIPGQWHFVTMVRLASPTRLLVYVDEHPVALIGVMDPPCERSQQVTNVVATYRPPSVIQDVAASNEVLEGRLGILLTVFYGGKTEDWAAPRDSTIDVGGFALLAEAAVG